MSIDETAQGQETAQTLRPQGISGGSTTAITSWLTGQGFTAEQVQAGRQPITGVAMDSREIQVGDLYVALPGATVHGARFAGQAVAAGATALLTDSVGAALVGELPSDTGLIVAEGLRAIVGPLSAHIYNSQPQDGSDPTLFAVTGTNGKTTTTYMVNSLMQALGETTGLIGTIEILAGGEAIPSRLTTPESPQVHSLLALMRQRGISSMAMEVSSHALDYLRVDGVRYDVAGFTNLTQDHLDLHGSMENYRESKAKLFTAAHTRTAVITADDIWGQTLLNRAQEELGDENTVGLYTNHGAGYSRVPDTLVQSHWALIEVKSHGIGHSFTLVRGDGTRLEAQTQLPADFNVSNAALATVMVYESGVDPLALQQVLREPHTLTPIVPGRMQMIGSHPTAIVDFAHNPDALQRALEAIRPANGEGKVIVVFGATGQRDQLKRPVMGEIAARYADIVIITDDDPHNEDPESIRDAVEAGALAALTRGAQSRQVLKIAPRATAIATAFELAEVKDSVLIAGRGHETAQDVAGTNFNLDDRVEVARSLSRQGFEVLPAYRFMLEGEA